MFQQQDTLLENKNISNSEDKDSVLLDFSNYFKGNSQRPKLCPVQQAKENQSEVIQNNVPRNLTITQEEMKLRRCLDVRRWYCLSRPQYQRSCGISSVVTVWNYLFSTLGTGQLPPLSQEEVIVKLAMAQEVEFGSFSGNMALMKWFKSLCRLFKVQGRAFIMWKEFGKDKTPGIDREVALQKMEAGLQSDKFAYIYHAYDHYFCPVGYEVTPNKGPEAYQPLEQINKEIAEHWIIIAEPAKPYPFFTVRKWKDVATDIELELPKYTNIRKMDEGIKEYKNSFGDSQHCIMQFERVETLKKVRGKKVELQQEESKEVIEVTEKKVECDEQLQPKEQLQEKVGWNEQQSAEQHEQQSVEQHEPQLQEQVEQHEQQSVEKHEPQLQEQVEQYEQQSVEQHEPQLQEQVEQHEPQLQGQIEQLELN